MFTYRKMRQSKPCFKGVCEFFLHAVFPGAGRGAGFLRIRRRLAPFWPLTAPWTRIMVRA